MRILLIEDDAETALYVAQGLAAAGHDVATSADGRAGLLRAAGESWDLLIVDRMLPGLDGLALVRTLRASNLSMPVLFLTTLGGIDDRVAGLNAGGDDYLVKPFALAELAARVAALGRRPRGEVAASQLHVADLDLDLLTRRVQRGGQRIDLQPREFQILEFLMRHAGQVVTRTMLLEQVWQYDFDPRTNIVDSHMSRLRGKIDRQGDCLIRTIRGAGYMICAPEPTA